MKKRIKVMNVELDNYSTRESMTLVDSFLNNTVLNTIEEISLNMVVKAGEDEKVLESLKGLDLAIPGEKELLIEAGYRNSPLMVDIESGSFFYEFCKRVIRNRKKVYLIGETGGQVDSLRAYLEREFERIEIIGGCALEDFSEENGAVNEVNIEAPDVVLSVIPSPRQEFFLLENKSRIHAKVWYGMNDCYQTYRGGEKVARFIKRLLIRASFKQRLTDYRHE